VSITRHEISATMTTPVVDLKPISASVTLDEAWSPYARATLVCPIPGPPVLLTQIDPRQNDRVTIVLKRTDVQTLAVQTRTFNLGLRERIIDYVDGTMTLQLSGDELLLQDFLRYQNVDAALTPPATSSLKALVNWGLNTAIPGASLTAGSSDATIEPTRILFKLGDPMWGMLDGFVRGSALRLWCDEARTWRLGPPLVAAGTITLTPTVLNSTLTREPWADAVVIENTWTDSFGDIYTVAISAYIATPPGPPTKGFILRNASATIPTSAAALALFNRMYGRGGTLTVQAVSDYTVTPGVVLNYMNVPQTPANAMVSSVTWELPSDEMTITTRDKPTTTLRAGQDVLTCLDTTYTPDPTDPPVTAGPEQVAP
jgi:hypothetical protein